MDGWNMTQSLMSGYRYLWLAWGFAFLVLEFTAIIRRRYQDTLSDFIWRLCDTVPGSTPLQYTAVHVLTIGFMIWLTIHIGFGIWR